MRVATAQRALLELLLTPVARYFLRKSLTIQTFYDVAKSVFLAVAIEELERADYKINVSRLSAMTGITRRDVTRMYHLDELPKVRSGISIGARVIGQWEQDPQFCTSARRPRVLKHYGEESEFRELVESVSTSLNASTVLLELQRIGAIEVTPRGIKLVKNVDHSEDEERWRVELAAQDIDLLLQAVDDNIHNPELTRNLHIHTEADNVVEKDLPKIRSWLLEEGKRHHKRVRDYLAKFDTDISRGKQRAGRSGARVVFSSFSYCSHATPTENSE